MKLSNMQIVGLITIIVIIFIIYGVFSLIQKNKPAKIDYLTYTKEEIEIKLNESYIEYVEVGEDYEEKGATAKYKNNKLKVIITYYKDGKRVSQIDTSKIGTYQVKYTAITKYKKTKSVYKTVIINDTKSPTLIVPENQTITASEALAFDLENGVIVNDNSGTATLTYDSTLSSINGNHIITYTATDKTGNKTTKKRLIKVTSGIVFEKNNETVKITFPKSDNYTYSYSLDNGYTFIPCEKVTEVPLKKGSIIATVKENEKTIISNSYTKKI